MEECYLSDAGLVGAELCHNWCNRLGTGSEHQAISNDC